MIHLCENVQRHKGSGAAKTPQDALPSRCILIRTQHRRAALLKDCGRSLHGARQQIGLQASLHHLLRASLKVSRHADGDRLLLAHFIFQNAQRLIEIIHHEIADAEAQHLLGALAIRIDSQHRCSGHTSGHHAGDALRIEAKDGHQASACLTLPLRL